MAVTRIKNNQITDATIVGSSKLQDYSVSAAKIANNLTYGSDLTVTGNLTVQGNVTAVDTVNLVVEDPIIVLAENQTGSPAVDIGFIGRRGTSPNITFVWDESAQTFVTGFTSDLITNTTVTISSYASFATLDANVTGNLYVTGVTSLTGNLIAGNVNILTNKNIDVGNNIIGNLQEPQANSDAATKGYVDSVSSSGFTIEDDTANTTVVAGGDTLVLNGTANEVTVAITAADEITFGLPSNVTIGDTLTVTNGANVGSLNSTGNVIAGNLNANAAVTGVTITASGNVVAGNVNSNAAVTGVTGVFSGNVLAANVNSNAAVTGVTGVFSGNVLAANVNSNAAVTGVTVTASGNLNGNNATITNAVTAATVTTTGNVVAGNLNSNAAVTGVTGAFTGNVSAGNISVTGALEVPNLTVSGNVLAGNLNSNAAVTGVTITASGNLVGGNANITNGVYATTVTTTGNVLAGNLNSNAAVTGVTGTFSGNVVAGNVNSNAAVTGATATFAGNVVAGNLNSNAAVTGVTVTASGNVNGGNINSNNFVGTSVTITSTGNLNLEPTGNIVLNNKYINGVSQPVQDNDAASKIYVDNMVSTQLAYHEAVVAATTGTLATATGGTVTYNNGTAGVNATLTTTGAFNLIDTANVQTVGTRILVKNEANAAWNGVYTYANTTAIVRSTDTDEYGPNSSEQLSINDYFFVSGGSTNAGSAWICDAPTGVITFGTSNIQFAQFSSSQTYSAGNGIVLVGTVITAKVDENTTSFDGLGNIIVKANANLTTPNIGAATGTSLNVSGNVLGGNINSNAAVTGVTITASGNVIAGNVNSNAAVTGVTITASGNLEGNNATITNGVYTATVTATGNVVGGNINSNAAVTGVTGVFSGNVLAANVNSNAAVTGVTITASGNVVAGNVNSNAAVTGVTGVFSGNVLAANVNSNAAVTGVTGVFSGNVIAGNLNSNAAVTGVNGVFTGNVDAGNVNVTTALNVPSLTVTGNVLAGNLNSNAAVTGVTITASGNVVGGNVNSNAAVTGVTGVFSGNVSAGNLSMTGNLTSTAGNVNVGNVNVTNHLTASDGIFIGNVDAGNIIAIQMLTAPNLHVGNINGIGSNGNITLDPAGNGNVILADQTANRMLFTGANKEVLTNANATFDGANLVITGSATVDDIVLNGSAIDTTNGATQLTINSGSSDVNFAVNGTAANVFFVDAGTNTASFGSGTQTTGALVAFNTNTSILLPVGNTASRPTGTTGMMRFNTSLNNLEFYDNDSWETAGSQFTVIAANTQTGTGSQTVFNLPQDGTTAGTIVAINGVVQIPVTAYSVSGNVCTFTEAPESTDVIDFRQLTTTSEVGALSGAGGGQVEASDTANEVDITGNLVPTGNLLYNLGDPTHFWKTLYVGGNSIYLGSLILKDNGANTFAVYTADGTTEANIAVGNIDVTSIASGTSTIGIAAPNGNGFITAGGNATFVVTPTGANIAGTLNATGNANVGNLGTSGNITASYLFGNGSQLSGIDATSIQSGTSAVSVISSGGNIRANVAGATVQTLSTGGANITGYITATGNVTGNYILGNGSQLTGIDATSIQNGTANVRTFNNGNVTVSAAGIANVVVVTSTGANIAGTLNATGNANVGNLGATNVVATNVAGTLTTAAQTNITSVGTLTSLAVTGNLSGGNIATAGTATIGGFTISSNTIVSSGSTMTLDPAGPGGTNGVVVIQGNLQVEGTTTTINSNTVTTNDLVVSVANNAINGAAANGGGFEVGPVGAPYITWLYNNTSNAWTSSGAIIANGNITGSNVGTAGTVTAATVNAAAIGNSGATLTGTLQTAAQTNITSVGTLGSLSVTGNITSGNVSGTAGTFTNVTGTLQTAAQTNITSVGTITGGTWNSTIGSSATFAAGLSGANLASITGANVTGTVPNATTAGTVTTAAQGNITSVGTLTGLTINNATIAITNGAANGSGNIGSSSGYFNTVFAKATSAQYADLAEKYTADAEYAPGTVLEFGGDAEVTLSTEASSSRVAGVVSTNPSYIMNATLEAEHVAMVALQGRVPCRVVGPVRKGDMMVAAGNGAARVDNTARAGTIIGKALENFDGAEGTIEVVVGRN